MAAILIVFRARKSLEIVHRAPNPLETKPMQHFRVNGIANNNNTAAIRTTTNSTPFVKWCMYKRMIRINLIQTLISIQINSPSSKVFVWHCVCVCECASPQIGGFQVCMVFGHVPLSTNCDWCLQLNSEAHVSQRSDLEVELLCVFSHQNRIYGFSVSLF